MNTVEIEHILRNRAKGFDGVFSIDTLPPKPHLLVCNTDPSTKSGRHWVCIWIEDDRGEYFDSFGRAPNEIFERYLNSKCSSWIFNDRQLQSVVSKFCGHYCIYYCMLRSRGVGLRKIVSNFTSDTGLNDVIVHRFACVQRY
jgi:hypothetical protein